MLNFVVCGGGGVESTLYTHKGSFFKCAFALNLRDGKLQTALKLIRSPRRRSITAEVVTDLVFGCAIGIRFKSLDEM